MMSRYYDPETGRFISPDNINFLKPEKLTELNLYSYCANNPIMYQDPSGHDWNSFWNNINSWFEKTVGVFVDNTSKFIKNSVDFVFGGKEEGVILGDTIGDDSKPISIYAQTPEKWWKFWEYKLGVKLNFKNFNFSYDIAIGEVNMSIASKDTSFSMHGSLDKISITGSSTNGNTTAYNEYYIRPLRLVAVAIAVTYLPGVAPAILIPVL